MLSSTGMGNCLCSQDVQALFPLGSVCYINFSLRVRFLLRREIIVPPTSCDNRDMSGINSDTF